jgi:hypothetical protein
LEAYVLESGNDISEYRRVVQRYQESTKMQYEYIRKANAGSYTTSKSNAGSYATSSRRNREKPPLKAITAGADKQQVANPS